MFYRNKHTKAVADVNGNSTEGKKLAKSDDWDRIEAGDINDPDLPSGVVDHPTVPEVVNPEITPE